MKTKKYPLLVSMIISCVLIVASLFILGFFGMNLGTSLGGGTQIEITMPKDADSKEYVEIVKKTIKAHDNRVESAFVEDKYLAADENGEFTQRCLIVKIANTNISDKLEKDIRYALADNLDLDVSNISNIEIITSVVKAKNVLFLGLAIGIIAICMFVLGWIRYDILSGLSFIVAYLHNIILYLSVLILTRVQLNLISLGVLVVLTLAMTGLLISIYEKNREATKMHTADKMTVSERLIDAEKKAVKPYIFVGAAVLVFALLMLFVPVLGVTYTAINIIIALVVTAYTGLLVGPAVYASLLEVKDFRIKAIMSRNEAINKEIQKKVRKNAPKKAKAEK